MGKTSAAPTATPPSTNGGNSQKPSFDEVMYQRNLFFVTVLNMSWQLAVVVIVPIVGGFKLDEHFGTSPWYTVGGFVLSLFGIVAVMMRTVRQATAQAMHKTPGDKQ